MIINVLVYFWACLVAQLVKESTCNAGDLGSIPELGRSPGGGHPQERLPELPLYLVSNTTLEPQLENTHETPQSS